MAEHNELGRKGEALALEELQRKGYSIVAKNWRYGKAEIDIIARDSSFLVAVEVKTRSSIAFGNPQDFVNPRKIKRMIAAMDYFITSNDINLEVRFDIVAITNNKNDYYLEHLEGAFHAFD